MLVASLQTALILLVGGPLFATVSLADDPYGMLVREIIETPQLNDGDTISNLVALGPEAVPAIGEALRHGVAFPATLVHAIGRIGVEDGMDPLLDFLHSRTPYTERDSLSITTILALKGVHNVRACKPLSRILNDMTVDPSIRLASARTNSYLCSDNGAQDFLLDAYQSLSTRRSGEARRYSSDEVLLGLIDVNSDKSETILIGLLHFEGNVRTHVPIITHLSSRGGEEVSNILLEVIGNKDMHEYPIRVAAVLGLVKMKRLPLPALSSFAAELLEEGKRDSWPDSFSVEVELLVSEMTGQ